MLSSGLPEHVSDAEVIARHLFRDNDIVGKRGAKARPHRRAFMPLLDEKTNSWVISVSRTELLPDQEAVERNGLEVGKVSNRVLEAFTRITAADVRSVPCLDQQRKKLGHMDVHQDEPPPYHAHLVKYPELIEGENPKLLQMECAQELAERAAAVTWRTLPIEPWEEELRNKRK